MYLICWLLMLARPPLAPAAAALPLSSLLGRASSSDAGFHCRSCCSAKYLDSYLM
jgi:hypothetical protein